MSAVSLAMDTLRLPKYCWDSVKIETEREVDGRWIADVTELPGVLAYGESRDDAIAKVKALALRVMADRLEHGEAIPDLEDVFEVAA
jgi:predicted RNase H-like HicB family nuclease